MLLNKIIEKIFKKEVITPTAPTNLFLELKYRITILLETLKERKDYSQLQILEETLRDCLLKTLEIKGEIGMAMVKKDFEMNKELLEKIQEQIIPQPPIQKVSPQTKPRFNVN